jgi:hypothetical protein
MNILWSSLDESLRDTLLHSAQGDSFRRLSDWYGFVYQYGFEEGSWRRALRELAYGRRGTKRTTFDVVRHCLRQYDEVFKVTVNQAVPHELIFAQAITDPTLTEFTHRHVNRYIETPWGIVRSVGPRMCDGSTVQLADISTFYWRTMTEILPDDLEYAEEFEVRFLPFEYYEWQPGPVLTPSTDPAVPEAVGYHYGDPCLIDVYVFGNLLPNVPSTYLQPDGIATPSGVPFGGQLLTDEFEQGDPRGIGPHPLYLVSPEIFEGLRVQIQASLAAGVELRMRRALVSGCTAP